MESLILVVELGGPTMFARRGHAGAEPARARVRSAAQRHALGKAEAEEGPMTKVPPDRYTGKSVGGKPGARDSYRCELCGARIEFRDLREVLAHEGPLLHPVDDRKKNPPA
jgi:hypothetical protein